MINTPGIAAFTGYNGLYVAAHRLKKQYPFLQCFPAGRSVAGRNIITFLIGSGKPAVLYVGGHRALEYITSMALLKFTSELCRHMNEDTLFQGYDIKRILSKKSVYIIPMLNPDGVELQLKGAAAAGPLVEKVYRISGGDFTGWQANLNGVDLNRNYNAGWEKQHQLESKNGILGPAPRYFGGFRPESEPETQSICKLCRRVMFSRMYAFHSQGERIYWNFGKSTPKSSWLMARKLADSCGYKVSKPDSPLLPDGLKDWFISVFKRPGFTVEIGQNKDRFPVGNLGPVYARLVNLLLLGLTI